jgi:threonyl-tRNA synthetase
MDKGTQIELPLSDVLDAVIKEVGEESLSFYHPSRDFIITDEVMSEEKMKRVTLD